MLRSSHECLRHGVVLSLAAVKKATRLRPQKKLTKLVSIVLALMQTTGRQIRESKQTHFKWTTMRSTESQNAQNTPHEFLIFKVCNINLFMHNVVDVVAHTNTFKRNEMEKVWPKNRCTFVNPLFSQWGSSPESRLRPHRKKLAWCRAYECSITENVHIFSIPRCTFMLHLAVVCL